jgi:hypothetical protein
VAVTGPATDTQLRATPLPVSGTVTATGPLTDTQLRATAVPVSPPTLTKGTQAASGFSTQDLKDSGRVAKTFQAAFTAATTEAILTLVPVVDGAAGGGTTTFAVTSGKRLRLVAISVTTRNAGAAGQGVACFLRVNSNGAAIVTSPIVATVGAGTALAITNVVGYGYCPLDIELSGTQQLAVTAVGTATAGNVVTLIGYEY